MTKNIRINKDVSKKKGKKSKKMKVKVPNIIRLIIIGILSLVLIFSFISYTYALQKPTTTQTKVTTIEYRQVGNYNYVAYLNDSLIYEGKETLRQGEGTIFKEITNHLNGTFTYTLSTNKKSDISVIFTITAQIETEFWNKTYTILSDIPISFSGTTAAFIRHFPINYNFYENITSQIEEETGVTIADPMLLIKTEILLTINADGEKLFRTFTPSFTVSLKKPTIDFKEGSDNQDSGRISNTEEFYDQEIVNERNIWGASSLILLIILIIFTLATESKYELSKTGMINKKIMKKYKEWIVDVNKEPKKTKTEKINVNSFEDLLKISEELGKPIFHYSTEQDSHHYYVIDESITYQYNISSVLWKKKQK